MLESTCREESGPEIMVGLEIDEADARPSVADREAGPRTASDESRAGLTENEPWGSGRPVF